ncbi:hypothetical protein PUN28_005768 [Cardiocondyla obscurior]|uniref:Uncharacterized protein n=1 Tax=Cardiocondyla obscurior TaxID=286306 RepID=A0AAW2G8D7_9HYME
MSIQKADVINSIRFNTALSRYDMYEYLAFISMNLAAMNGREARASVFCPGGSCLSAGSFSERETRRKGRCPE